MPVKTSEPLSATHPVLAGQWNFEKNKKLTPDDVTSTSSERVFWQCPVYKSHVWKAAICDRAEPGQIECPYCWSKKAGKNRSLAELNPEAAALWHPTKNKSLSPADVSTHSAKLVWWQCQTDSS